MQKESYQNGDLFYLSDWNGNIEVCILILDRANNFFNLYNIEKRGDNLRPLTSCRNKIDIPDIFTHKFFLEFIDDIFIFKDYIGNIINQKYIKAYFEKTNNKFKKIEQIKPFNLRN